MTTPTPREPEPEIKMVRLSSGEMIIALCSYDYENGLLRMDNPFEMIQHFSTPVSVPNIGFVRWMMFAENDTIAVPFSHVQTVATPRASICQYYQVQVEDYVNHTSAAIDSRLERALSDVVPTNADTPSEVRQAMIEKLDYEGKLQ